IGGKLCAMDIPGPTLLPLLTQWAAWSLSSIMVQAHGFSPELFTRQVETPPTHMEAYRSEQMQSTTVLHFRTSIIQVQSSRQAASPTTLPTAKLLAPS